MQISVAVQSHEKGTETTCTKTWLCGKVCASLLLTWTPVWDLHGKTLTSYCRQICHWNSSPPIPHRIKTRNIFWQYNFAYFSFVGRAGMDKSVACVCLHGSAIILMMLTGNKNNTAKFTGRGKPETAKVWVKWDAEKWSGKDSIQSWNISQFVQKNVRSWGKWEPLWQVENSFWVVSVLYRHREQQCQLTPFLLIKVQKYPAEWAHQVHTWDSSYSLAL